MAGKNITIAGAVFNGVPSIDVPVSGGGTASFVEISDTTAQAADVASGKYFYTAAGVKTEGTASGGGGGGLEYETGAWTPTVDTGQGQIYFAKTHTNLPCLIALSDTSEDSTSVSSSVMAWTYYEAYTMWGAAMPQSPTVLKYGVVEWVYTSGSSSSQGNVILNYPPTSGSSSRLYPRYWVDEAWFKPYAYNTNNKFRAGRTYKWIAIWAPSS